MKNLKRKVSFLFLVPIISFGIFSCDMDIAEEPLKQSTMEEDSLQEEDHSGDNLRISSLISFEETFEGDKAFSGQSHQFAADHAFKITVDPASAGNKAGRFELRDSDPRATKTGIRAEVGFRALQKEGWYAYSVYFPTEGYNKDNNPEIITQWHQSGGGSPPNALHVEDDKIYFRSINRSDTKDNSNKVYTNYPIANVERGKWNEFVFHIIHATDSEGLIEIWHNNKKIHTLKGPNMRSGFPLPNFKLGIYKWSWDNGGKTQTNRRVLYFDNIRVGQTGATLEDVTSNGAALGNETSKPNPSNVNNDSKKEEPSNVSPVLTGFNLIQANSDNDLGAISAGAQITAPTHKLNIRANTLSSFKGEVRFKLSGTSNYESVDQNAPYSLFGDDGNGNYYYGPGLAPGNYTVQATSYVNGIAGKTETQKFTIKIGQEDKEIDVITGYNIIQANTDADLGSFSNGDVLKMNTHKLNIRVNTISTFKGTLHFKLSGAANQVYEDTKAPFSLFGDDGRGNYYYGSGLPTGLYTLVVTPYTGDKAGKSKKISFTIKK